MGMSTNKFTKTYHQLTEADIKAAEKRMGFTLPAELRAHYLKYNGGEPELRCWKSEHYDDNYLTGFFPIRKSNDLDDKELAKVETLDETVVELLEGQHMPKSFLPFAADGGGNYFCIDRDDGKIYFLPMDEDSSFDSRRRYLAASFNEFVEGLVKGDSEYL